MVRIGLDASPMVGDRGGVGWHTYYLLRAMLEAGEDVEFLAYLRPGSRPPEEALLWKGADRLQWSEASKWALRRRGKADRLDLYHGTNFRMHTTGRYGGVVTIHDLWLERFPQYSPKLLGQRLSSWKTKRTAKKARAIIAVSKFTARELKELYGLPSEQIAVIPNGVSDDFVPCRDDNAIAALRRRIGLSNDRFILFVGGADPRKNHRGFLEAAALVRKQLNGRTLLLIGSKEHPFGSYEETARSLRLSEQVHCPGRLPIADIRLLYSYAELFVFPSLYEGFGMPVLEAMACGAPVITSKTTALGEVAGDAAVLVSPNDPRELGEAMVRVIHDEGLRATLKEKGLIRVKQFTWQRAAAQTLEMYAALCR